MRDFVTWIIAIVFIFLSVYGFLSFIEDMRKARLDEDDYCG